LGQGSPGLVDDGRLWALLLALFFGASKRLCRFAFDYDAFKRIFPILFLRTLKRFIGPAALRNILAGFPPQYDP
jgi:hypothetical protein